MAKFNCGTCIACTKFNGRNGNGYQPCHRPINIPSPPKPPAFTNVLGGSFIPKPPKYVPPPPLVYLYGDEPNDQAGYEEKPSWIFVWFFGLCLGISIGLLIAKSL